MFYDDYYILGQIIEAANVPTDIENYECGPEEVKFYCLQFDLGTREFRGLYETVGLIIVRSDNNETFFNYEFRKEKTKLLYSLQRWHIQNSFSGTPLNKHKDMIANHKLKGDLSNLFLFLSSVTGRLGNVNKYLNNVSIRPVDITKTEFKQWTESGVNLEPQYLELFGEKNAS